MMTPKKILVVDDEPGARSLVQVWLEEVGHEVYTAADGWDALELFSQQLPTLTIVDMRMPGMDGFRLIRHIRDISDAYVLALTALGEQEHLIRGLELGADEYVTKPVARREFLARVQSLLRRAEPPSGVSIAYSDSILTLNLLTHEASVLGESLQLRPTEYRLLAFLALNKDRVLSHDEILDRVWSDHGGSLDSLKWYISSLRVKISNKCGDSHVIVNLPRVGYRYCPPESFYELDRCA